MKVLIHSLMAGLALVVLAAGQVSAQRQRVLVRPAPAPAPASATIFVPQPKGDETLDDSAGAGAAKDAPDTAYTLQGDRVSGKIVGVEAGGVLRLQSPQFDGDVLLRAEALERIELGRAKEGRGDDEVVLVNNDRLLGSVTGITADEVLFKSDATGPLKVTRKVVRAISFGRGKTTLLDCDFANDDMAPLKNLRGSWRVAGNQLVNQSHGHSTVVAALEQKEALTMEVKGGGASGNAMDLDLVLFADNTQGQYGANSVIAMFRYNDCYFQVSRNNSVNSIAQRNVGGTMQKGTVRFAYDPDAGKVRGWYNSTDLGEYVVPNQPKTGQYIMLTTRQPCTISSLKVYRGIVPPGEDVGKAEEARDVVRLANKDRISAELVTMNAEGVIEAKTTYGNLTFPVDKVGTLLFQTKAQENLKAPKGAVLVETANSRFTLVFSKLTADMLSGRAEHVGEVNVRRDMVRRVLFKLPGK